MEPAGLGGVSIQSIVNLDRSLSCELMIHVGRKTTHPVAVVF